MKTSQSEDRGLRIANGRKNSPSLPQSSILNPLSSFAKRPRPIELARLLYREHGHDFEKDLREFRWPYGFIIDQPDCFAIAFATKTEDGEWAWFVKTAVGNLGALLRHFPVPLPFIRFCREKTGKKMKTYRLDRLVAAAQKLIIHHRERRGRRDFLLDSKRTSALSAASAVKIPATS